MYVLKVQRRSPSPSQTYRPQSNLPRRSPSPSPSQTYPSREYIMRRSQSPSQVYVSQSNVPRRSPVGASPPLVIMPTPTHPLDRDGDPHHEGYVGEVTVEMGRIYRADPSSPTLSPPIVYANTSYDHDYDYDYGYDHRLSYDELAGMEEDMEGDESGELAVEVRTPVYCCQYLLLPISTAANIYCIIDIDTLLFRYIDVLYCSWCTMLLMHLTPCRCPHH